MADKTRLEEAPTDTEVQVAESDDLIQKKVQLDLDDAPFLQEKEQAVPPTEDEGATEQGLPEGAGNTAPTPKIGKKKLIVLVGAVFLLVAALAAGWWFFLRKPPPLPSEAAKPEVVVVPSKPATQAVPDYVREFSPFLVYHPDGAGEGRFLVCKFATLTKVQTLNREMDQKILPLRDAVYFYLRSKTPEYLTNSGSLPEIKKDLTAVINHYLTQGQIEDILFESYLNE
ncbi:MAG: flagellar basal body-associated FliL family protein [Desulfovibrio sp.]|nr:flagellar basal body-associated FliL family protein [Desulfovibrio sp.]